MSGINPGGHRASALGTGSSILTNPRIARPMANRIAIDAMPIRWLLKALVKISTSIGPSQTVTVPAIVPPKSRAKSMSGVVAPRVTETGVQFHHRASPDLR